MKETLTSILRLFHEGQDDVRRFINDHLANGFSFGRVDKYLTSLVSILRSLNKSFKTATTDDCKAFVLSKSSDMVSRYVHIIGRDVDELLLAVYGKKKVTKNSEPIIKEWSCPQMPGS